MEWYYADSGQRLGPIDESELQALQAAGKVQGETLVWRAGMPEWQPLSEASVGLLAEPLPAATFCSECGRQINAADLVSFGGARVCADCKDVFFQRVREQGAAAATQTAFNRYGGFWIRFLARLIDGIILSVVFIAIAFVWALLLRHTLTQPVTPGFPSMAVIGSLGFVYLLCLACSVLYEAWFLAHRGATPGKLALSLRVVRSSGAKLTTGRSFGRAFGYLLNGLIPLAIGFIIAGFDSEKRALHDHICDTRVVFNVVYKHA